MSSVVTSSTDEAFVVGDDREDGPVLLRGAGQRELQLSARVEEEHLAALAADLSSLILKCATPTRERSFDIICKTTEYQPTFFSRRVTSPKC